MRFGSPSWLAAGAFACVLLLFLWYRYDKRQYAALGRFVAPLLRDKLLESVSVGRRRLRRALTLAALGLLFVALAGPQLGYRWEQTSRRGNEIVFAVDTSRSMGTVDVKPNRLGRAKLAIDDFANRLDGDAVGLVAFAGTAFLACPITLDYGAFFESLNALDTNTIPLGGTNIASAIREADNALERRPGSDKILILVTDGEDLEGDALAAAKEAHQRDGLKIFTVGVGTANGDLIPLTPDQGSGFIKDSSGAFVKSRLDEKGLADIAAATDGLYAPLGTQGEGFDILYRRALGPLAKHDLAARQQKIYIERYQWPLTAALGCLLLSLCVGNRRRSPRRRTESRNARHAPVAALLCALPLQAAAILAGCGLILSGRDAPAAEAQPVLQYNAGTRAYREGKFPQAAQAFQQAITAAPSNDRARLAEQEDAYYNLGNTLYRTGQSTEKSSPQQTLQTWNQAVKAYETALQLRADDADSKFNRDLVKRKIAALQQQQQNQKNPDKEKNKDKSKNGQSGDGKDPSGGNGRAPPDPKQNPQQSGQQQAQPPPPQDPQQPGQSKQQQPGQANPPPAAQQPSPPPPGDPQRKDQPGAGADQNAGSDAQNSDDQREPGQMSREEARELLDSEKGEERAALGAPIDRNDARRPPDKPVRDW